MTDWATPAQELAATVVSPESPWWAPVAETPRHAFIPRWFARDTYTVVDGPSDPGLWLATAYGDTSVVTRVGPVHADHATPGIAYPGVATSSATMPGLVVRMLELAEIHDDDDVLDIATGSGYSAALLSRRLGDTRVTSVDIDAYLVEAAAGRLAGLGSHPRVLACDATGPIPGTHDVVVSMVSVRPIPVTWLASLRPGGRLVTVIAGTHLLLTATKSEAGHAYGRIEQNGASFMRARSGVDYPPRRNERFIALRDMRPQGEQVTRGRLPLVRITDFPALHDLFEVTVPGVDHRFTLGGGPMPATAWMIHDDGSWAWAACTGGDELPVVHQGGPRRLWNILDDLRETWSPAEGGSPLPGAQARIDLEGVVHLRNGEWTGRIF
ncbi:methyltransferase domain-containing protein [Rhizohabitans arisaemae]|uniref:methyltransferase domain-containing protein n=1 Tax=Rhizohabitans arisaemae TaxID=2720610 RepID=UPI0024B0C43A|nr:methyltransferase domain-containing protein [Rhizohabitans arisaemae]